MMTREKIGFAALAATFIGVGAYACSSDDSFGNQPFINDVPSSTVTNPPAPPDTDAPMVVTTDGASYDTDASYSTTLCEQTCGCDFGSGQYCVGSYTGLTFDQCDIPDAGDGGPPPTFRMGCNYVPQGCIDDGGPPYCPCIVASLGALPCLPVCVDETNGQVELYCPNP